MRWVLDRLAVMVLVLFGGAEAASHDYLTALVLGLVGVLDLWLRRRAVNAGAESVRRALDLPPHVCAHQDQALIDSLRRARLPVPPPRGREPPPS